MIGKKGQINSLLGVAIIAIAMFVFGYTTGSQGGFSLGATDVNNENTYYKLVGELNPDDRVENLDFNVFWNVWDTLENYYIESDLNEKEMLDGAIKGMVSSLGDYATSYYSIEDTAEYERISAGNFEGIGAELGYQDGQIIIKSPLRDYPAQKAGLRPLDKILKIDGASTQGLDIVDAVLKIRGESGSTVTLTIPSEDEEIPREVDIVRESIHIASVEYDMVGEIAVIEVRRFTENTFAEWMSAWDSVIDSIYDDNPKGLVLDLRGNPGGFFDAAVWAASDFLENGSIVAYQQDRNGSKKTFRVSRDGKLLDIPLIVMVDEGSASASEILAGALKYHNRATVLGKSTFGKGTAQQVLDLDGGATLHITTQKWLLPDSSWISEDNKIEPDVEVDFSREDFEGGVDPQLNEAIELLKTTN